MKAKTIKLNHFPGDTAIRIDIHRTIKGKVQVISMFCIEPHTDSRGRYYTNDINGLIHNTITEAKSYAIGKFLMENKCNA